MVGYASRGVMRSEGFWKARSGNAASSGTPFERFDELLAWNIARRFFVCGSRPPPDGPWPWCVGSQIIIKDEKGLALIADPSAKD